MLTKKIARVHLHRKRIAPEAPSVRIMKGFRQPPSGKKVPTILVGSDYIVNTSPPIAETAQPATVGQDNNVAGANAAATKPVQPCTRIYCDWL